MITLALWMLCVGGSGCIPMQNEAACTTAVKQLDVVRSRSFCIETYSGRVKQ